MHMHLNVDVHARYATDPDRSAVRIRPFETGSNAIPIAVDPSAGQAGINAEPSSRRGGEGSCRDPRLGVDEDDALRSCGAKHGDLWKALWDLGVKIEVVAVVRRWKEYGRTSRVLANWSRYPRPSEIDEETRRDLARIEQAILGGDVRTLDEYSGLQAALERAIVLEDRARRRAGRGLTERVDTWMTDRLAWARFYWET